MRRNLSPALAFASLILAAVPSRVIAQATVTLSGRVFEAGTATGIQNAVVEVAERGGTLTGAGGTFRFQRVTPGEYTLTVSAYGYTTATAFVVVKGNTTVDIPLEIAPIALDAVTSREIDVEGRVHDPARDILVVDADVLSSLGVGDRTDSHGHFKVEDVTEQASVRLTVRAFGYLPMDSVVVARKDEKHLFELSPDTIIERMLTLQDQRLEKRAAPRFSVRFKNLDREKLLQYAGAHTLMSVLESMSGGRRFQVGCVMLDEVQLHPDVDRMVLSTTLPEEVERMEFLSFSQGTMLRIYTRRFMQTLIARDTKLTTPSLVRFPGNAPPLCR